jgi:hypothetical protein
MHSVHMVHSYLCRFERLVERRPKGLTVTGRFRRIIRIGIHARENVN